MGRRRDRGLGSKGLFYTGGCTTLMPMTTKQMAHARRIITCSVVSFTSLGALVWSNNDPSQVPFEVLAWIVATTFLLIFANVLILSHMDRRVRAERRAIAAAQDRSRSLGPLRSGQRITPWPVRYERGESPLYTDNGDEPGAW